MIDPYASTGNCITRLLKEYETHKRLIVAVDFDDTVFDFHKAGHEYLGVLSLLRKCKELGFYVILFTGSPRAQWTTQCAHLAMLGVNVDTVNANPIAMPFGNDGKIYFNILLDDRAGLGQAFHVLNETISIIQEGR